ncbi:isoflavone-7-O-methyltransferase 9-like [Gastrolobium bilobum]|uniref:isoflavone-7-O-methyltransferase 9-like n=1 Tax=Gastrolobium bilobum TaxID=150636 RepID=UPI002AB001F5|nr:isoflavone-7-O-methyltransferase 9-like [Gastrolobium bilobum]
MASTNDYKASELFQAQAHLYRMMYSFLNPMCIKWAIDLGIPDIIHNHPHPITLPELVSALNVPLSKATCVERLMRLLAHNDFFAIIKIDDTREAYALTPSSQLLVNGTDHCLSSMVHLLNSPTLVGSYHHLGKWTSGEDLTIVETALGPGGYWDFIHQNPTHLKTFNEAMESDSHVVRLALRDCKSVFEGLDSIVDVGGGTGNTAKIICEAFPNLKYIVLDLPQVVTGLTGSNNLTFVGGNMFKSIPQADGVLLKWVLHNWSDDDCIRILKNCKEAISGKGKGGKVIIIDIVINEKQDELGMTEVKLLLDIAMMTSLNGKERDEKDWKRLFDKAGFEHYKIFPTFGFRSLIELYP